MIRLSDGPTHTKGDCAGCGRQRDLYRKRCLACRHKPEHRAMLEAGIPPLTAGALVGLMKKLKGKTAAEAESTISIVHPILMENLEIGEGWVLIPKSSKYQWSRGEGWELQ